MLYAMVSGIIVGLIFMAVRENSGAGAVILFTILSGVGFTGELALIAYSLILAINRPIEMLVTSLNCTGDAVACIAVAKSENKFDAEIYNR